VHIEVLRHPLAAIASPTSDDAKKYAGQVSRRIEAYTAEKLPYVLIEPQEVKNGALLSKKISEVLTLAMGKDVSVAVPSAVGNPFGHWFDPDTRIAAIRLAARTIGTPGRFPAYRRLASHNLGGLEAFYHRNKIDRQAEGIEAGLLCFPRGANQPRRPQQDEVVTVLRFHREAILEAGCNIDAVERVFGDGSLRTLREWHRTLFEQEADHFPKLAELLRSERRDTRARARCS
jgi:hypothetical protein